MYGDSVANGKFSPGTDFSDRTTILKAIQLIGNSISMGFNGIGGLYQNTITATGVAEIGCLTNMKLFVGM